MERRWMWEQERVYLQASRYVLSAHFILSEIILSDILMFRKYTFPFFREHSRASSTAMMVRLASVSRVPRISWGWLSLFLCCTLGFYTTYACQDSSLVLHCPQNSIINIQSAFYGRRSDKICPYGEGASGKLQRWESKRERLKCSCRSLMDWMNLAGVCTVEGTLALARMMCDNREFCFLFAHTDSDPCPPSPNTWRWSSAASRMVRTLLLRTWIWFRLIMKCKENHTGAWD